MENQKQDIQKKDIHAEPPPDERSFQIRRLKRYKENLMNRSLKATYVQWLCTDRCRFHCSHCDIPGRETSSDPLKTSEIIKALDSLSSLGCEVFSVIGGDPFQRKDLFDVLCYAKKRFMKIALTTHTFDLEHILSRIERTMPDSVMLCIDGHREQHDRIREKTGDYEECLHCLKAFYDMGIPVIGVSMAVTDENVRHIPQVIEDVYAAGGNKLRIQPLVSQKLRNSPRIAFEALRQVFYYRLKGFNIEASESFGYLGYLEPRVRSFTFFCGCGWDTMTIMPNGDVMGCIAPNMPHHVEGNMTRDDLGEIWFSRFQSFRDEAIDDLPLRCRACPHKEICRGGCWLFRVHNQDPCFLPQAEDLIRGIFT